MLSYAMLSTTTIIMLDIRPSSMSDGGDLNTHTFLSRVLGNANGDGSGTTNANGKKTTRGTPRTISEQDKKGKGTQRGFFPFTRTRRDDDVEAGVPFLNDDQTESQYSNLHFNMDDKILKNMMIMSEISLSEGNNHHHHGRQQAKRNSIQTTNSVNINSESEDSSEEEEEEDEDDNLHRPSHIGNRIPRENRNAIAYMEKEKIRKTLEHELQLSDGEPANENPFSQQTNGNGNGNIANRIEQSIMFQMKEVERKFGPTMNSIGEKALKIANDTIENSIMQTVEPEFITNKVKGTPKSTNNEPRNIHSDTIHSNTRKNVFLARKLPPKERALWMWANTVNLDIFLTDVYCYYIENGWNCIALSRMCDLATIIFVIWLTSFLGNCIDYGVLFNENVNKLSQVYNGKCYAQIPFTQKIFLYLVIVLLLIRLKNVYKELSDLREIKLFYNHLLDIDDSELQTITWPTIVKRIMILKNQNTNAIVNDKDNDLKSKAKLNAHDIANRIMRKENYMIALFNKNILNKPLTIPFINTHFLTKTLEWNLKLCIFDFLFNDQGQIKSKVLSQHHRLSLIVNLKKRFRLAGLLSVALSPILVIYFILYYFLKLFYDYKTNPGLLNARSYSPLAKWKMREYNELPHLFDQRLNLSIEHADDYLSQFPKAFSDIFLKFISYITGSIVTVLVILTIIDHENFLNFEITEGKTSLFYMSTLGAIFTVCKSAISNTNNKYLFDPETSLKKVSHYTHYLPVSWQNRYHTVEVKNQFCDLYNLKLILMLKELCSLVLLPYILYVSLPKSCDKVIDFFRDYSVHVDGIGYVCTFAMFNMNEDKDHVKTKKNVPIPISNQDNDDKMMQSYMYFMESYGANGSVKTEKKDEDVKKTTISFRNPTQTLLRRNINMNGNNSLLRSTLINTNNRATEMATGSGDFIKKEESKNFKAPYSTPTNDYLRELNNSMILGESFHLGNVPDFEGSGEGPGDSMDNDIDNTGGGVLGLLNQVYKHK